MPVEKNVSISLVDVSPSTVIALNVLSIFLFKSGKRWVKTQVLNLKSQEVQEVFNYLENNAESENKNYKYDFFYNNCATKIEDVIKIVLKEKVHFTNEHITSHKSHRDLIEDYTNQTFMGKNSALI